MVLSRKSTTFYFSLPIIRCESKAIKSNCIVFAIIVQCLQIAKFKQNDDIEIQSGGFYIKRHFSFDSLFGCFYSFLFYGDKHGVCCLSFLLYIVMLFIDIVFFLYIFILLSF